MLIYLFVWWWFEMYLTLWQSFMQLCVMTCIYVVGCSYKSLPVITIFHAIL